MVYLAGGGFWVVLGQFTSSVLAFVLSVAFANLVAPSDLGQYKYVLSVAGIVSAFSLTGLGTAVTQAVSTGHDRALVDGFRASLRWSIGMITLTLGASLYYFYKNNDFLGVSLLLVALVQPLLNSTALYNSFLIAKKLFKDLTLKQAGCTALTTLSLIATLFFTTDPLTLVIVYFSSALVGNGLAFFQAARHIPKQGAHADGLIGYAKNLSLMGVIGAIAGQIDKVVIFQFVGAAELAMYAFTIAIPEQIWGVVKGVGNMMLPKFAAYKRSRSLHDALPWKIALMGFFLLVATVVYVVLAPLLFALLFPAYMSAVPYSQFYALSLVALTSVIPVSMLTALRKERALYTLNISTSLLQIAAIVPMAMYFGLWGVVVTRVVMRYITFVLATGITAVASR